MLKSTLRPLAMAAALAVACSAALAAPAKPGKAARADIAIPDIPFTSFVLKNGLTVIVHEDHKTPVVAINTWYHVGSKNEKPGKTGFAHLFEHLMFSGSKNFDKTFLTAMEAIGANNLNGTTSNDRTNYFEDVPTSMLDYALFAESDRMGHLLGVLDQKKLDLQRGVVQNEKRQGENQPYGVTEQLLAENTYPAGHPYSWSVIGSMKDLNAASMDDVQEWFKTYYGPNNTVIVLAGDITPAQAREKMEKYFGEIPAGPPLAKHEAWVAKRSGSHRSTVQDRVPEARVYRVWNVPGSNTADEPLLDLAATVLGQGKSSRLYKRLVYKDQLASSVTAFNGSNEIAGQFVTMLTARPGVDSRKMEAAADEELRALLKTGPSAAELEIARTAILANYMRMMERVGGFGGKSDLLAQCQTYTGNPHCYKDYLQRIKDATPAAVLKAAQQWLSDGDYVLDVQPFDETLSTTAKLDRRYLPAMGKAEPVTLPPMQKATLSNGLKVVLAERHDAPLVNLEMLFDSGFASDKADSSGLARLALRLLDEGTPSRNSAQIAEQFDALGARFSTSANMDGVRVRLDALKATLPQALDIYADVLQNPAFAPKELERLKQEQLATILREQSDPNEMAMRVLPGLLYGQGHAYARPFSGSGSADSVERITRDNLLQHHQQWYRPNNATLVVVGDTTLAEVLPLLEKKFGGWKAGDVPRKEIASVPAPGKPLLYLMDKPGAGQSVIYAAQLAMPRSAPEALPLEVLNNVFGGTFSSRLNMNLREDKHWTYGAGAYLEPAAGQRPFIAYAPVQADKTRESLQEMISEYAGIAGAKPITAQELAAAQSYETLGLPGRFETAGQVAGAYASVLQYKLPEDYYNSFTSKVSSLTLEQANELARRTIVPGQLVWVVVGDMAKVEAGVRSLNIGEVRKIDAEGTLLP